VDFSLSDEQKMVRDTARSLFGQECTLELVHAAWADRGAATPLWDDHLSQWMELAGSDVTDLILFMEEHGHAAAPSQFFASLLAAQAAAAADLEIAGSATIAISARDGLWTANGGETKYFVPSAADVDRIVVVGGSPAAPTIAVVEAADMDAVEIDQMDRLRPMYRVTLDPALAGRPVAPAALAHAIERALVTVSAELIGVGRRLLDMSVEYARERVQFDRPIGSFQGLQWELVDAALDLERAAAAVAYAAMCVDADDPNRHRAVHGAKAEAGLAARRCARTGMQVHGGIGYTFEHGLHFWLRRAYAADAFMGPSGYHHDRVAELLFDG